MSGLRWTRPLEVALPGSGWRHVGNGRGAKPVVTHAAPGPLVVHAGGQSHAEARAEFVAEVELNALSIELIPIISFEGVLQDGDAIVSTRWSAVDTGRASCAR